MTNQGTFEELLAVSAPAMRDIAARLRDIILEIDAHAVEVVRLGDRAATYGLGPKKMSEGCLYVLPHTEHVNLGFYRGAHLDDPAKLLEGTGKAMRHVKIRSIDEAEDPAVRALIEAGLAERRNARS